ncbi:autotransporter outer membrane beta-barrel domain-containing protein, partial [Pontiella sp.]|uniref:autotransporter family protein n=1 Tax=Pontiella sp. TaxID=2837462 RepID=UPI0035643A79
ATSGSAYARAYAYAINGDVIGNVSGLIRATAYGGIATTAGSSASADAYASAVDGEIVAIPLLSTDLIATAIAGVATTNGVSRSGSAEAVAIRASEFMYLEAHDVSIHAVAQAADGYELPDGNPESYALMGGYGDDTVILDNVSLIGNVDLGAGNNRFVILGDTRLEGGLMGSGGMNQIELKSGLLKFAGGPTELDGLYDDELVVGKAAGLGFELQEDPASDDNTMLDIKGKLVVEDGAGIGAFAAAGQMADQIIGNTYTVITTTNGVDGMFVESSKSMFTVDVDVDGGSNVTVKATGMRPLDEGGTPGGVSAMQVVSASAIALFDDLSSHAGGMRAIMRTPSADPGSEEEIEMPEGVEGPERAMRRRLEDGEWLTYVRQINYIGSQDADGGFAGYDWNAHGFMVGAEKLVKDDMIVGGAAGGLWSDLDADGGAGGGNSDMFMASVYGNWFSETWYADFGLSYGHAWNDTERNALDWQRYTGDFDSNLLGAWLEGGYTFLKDGYEIEPYGRVTYVLGMHGSYTDGGGTQPLSVDSHTSHNLPVELGVRGARNWMLESGGNLRLALRTGLRIELLDNSMDPDGSLIGSDVPLQSPESDAAALVLGLKGDWSVSDRLNLSLEYEPVISGNWFYHNIAGEVSLRF